MAQFLSMDLSAESIADFMAVYKRGIFKSAEHKKSSSVATWIFCMEPNCFGVTRGE
nr:MAG TPA: hypothetical protein [Caudoviricetes sp.]